MRALFPHIKPYQQHELKVDDMHTLYIEESGSPQGEPILFVHGGPGAGCSVDDRRYFDPQQFRIILFDQRGCGRSTPHASLKNNTTSHLIEDLEKIRDFLRIKKWFLFGGSWGSTLSLLYAQAYPRQVSGLVLRGIFLCREKEFQWFYQHGANEIFPDYFEQFSSLIPKEERQNMIQAYYRRLTGDDELARMGAAKHWAQWEGQCATLHPSKETCDRYMNPHTAVSLARIETHYFMNNAFLEPNQILNDADKLNGIPGIIVHGRYDMVCPLDNALALHNVWENSDLHIIRDGGHSAQEPGIRCALLNAVSEITKYAS